jgi:predicted TIM-barrel fold metal-dependent hydrolase
MTEPAASCGAQNAGREIIDAHQHFWDLDRNHIPWLCDPTPIRFRYGDYAALRRNYLPDDFRRDGQGLPVVGSVCIEAERAPDDADAEVRWLSDLVAHHGLNSVIVAQARLDRADIDETLALRAANPLVRGVRHKPSVAAAPQLVQAGTPGSMSDPAWIAGFARLADHGLSFDLQVPWWHLDEARRLADDHPDIQIILDHTGLPADRSAEGIAGWRQAMSRLAGARNLAVKISGLGLPGRTWQTGAHAGIVRDTIAMFAPERCMFASNYPVDSLVGGYREILDGFAAIVTDFTAPERHALFAGTARRIYRMEPATRGEAR